MQNTFFVTIYNNTLEIRHAAHSMNQPLLSILYLTNTEYALTHHQLFLYVKLCDKNLCVRERIVKLAF